MQLRQFHSDLFKFLLLLGIFGAGPGVHKLPVVREGIFYYVYGVVEA